MKRTPSQRLSGLEEFSLKEREQYKHRIVPVSQLICLTPVQVSGRVLPA